METAKTPKSSPWSVAEVQCLLSLVAEDSIQKELDGTTRNHKVFKEISELMAVRGYPRTLQQCRDKLKKLKSDYRAIKDHNGRSGANRRSWRWFAEMDAIYGHRPSNNGRECGVDSASSFLLSIEDQSLPTTEMTDEPPRSPSPIPGEPPASTPAAASTQAAASITAESEISSNTQRVVTGTRRRGLFESDTVAVLREMHAADREEHALDREDHALDRAEHALNRAQRDAHLQVLVAEAREARDLELAVRREECAQTTALFTLMAQMVQALTDRKN